MAQEYPQQVAPANDPQGGEHVGGASASLMVALGVMVTTGAGMAAPTVDARPGPGDQHCHAPARSFGPFPFSDVSLKREIGPGDVDHGGHHVRDDVDWMTG
jgi:hypothetical protein